MDCETDQLLAPCLCTAILLSMLTSRRVVTTRLQRFSTGADEPPHIDRCSLTAWGGTAPCRTRASRGGGASPKTCTSAQPRRRGTGRSRSKCPRCPCVSSVRLEGRAKPVVAAETLEAEQQPDAGTWARWAPCARQRVQTNVDLACSRHGRFQGALCVRWVQSNTARKTKPEVFMPLNGCRAPCAR